jgi:hypothetical protein
MTKFRECGDCTACCSWLIGDAFGHSFGCGKTCKFLENSGCGVYKARPETCINYQCAWSQYLLPEEMRPDKCNFLCSVESNDSGQYIKVLPINNKTISQDVKNWFQDWSEKMNAPVIFLE